MSHATPHVVIIGSGFGGLTAAKALRRAHVKVTLLSPTTHHLFQPLLYQVATGILSPGDIAPTTRELVKRSRRIQVIQGHVDDIDLRARTVQWHREDLHATTAYDFLIVAAGAQTSYFGHDPCAANAPGLKTIDDALELRARIFGAFERAEIAVDQAEVERLLTFTVVGAGPTGVELAGQIRELAVTTLAGEFRTIDTTRVRVVLVDAAGAVLPTLDPRLSEAARRSLERLGVRVVLNATVEHVDENGLDLAHADGRHERIASECKVWAAGVRASDLGETLARQSGAPRDSSGRLAVEPDLSLPGHPEVFVIGDMMAVPNVPGVSPAAIQSAQHVTRRIRALTAPGGRRVSTDVPAPPFAYWDKGSMATISKWSAVAQVGRVRVTGLLAWLVWLVLHLLYIAGFKQRVTTLLRWAISFLSVGRSDRTITYQQLHGRAALRSVRGGESRPGGSGEDAPELRDGA